MIRIQRWFLGIFLVIAPLQAGYTAENFVLVIIDGARYSETFGDPDHTYVPQMYELSREGVIIDSFYNNWITNTRRGIPSIWCGAWTDVKNTLDELGRRTQYCVLPTFFEYYRKATGAPADDVYYVLKSVHSLWRFSYHEDYGPEYWPSVHSLGSTDREVWAYGQWVIDRYHPSILVLYLADVDHAGHRGDWKAYTSCIMTTDSIVAELWEKLQSDPYYAGKTDVIVTNDHGRDDDEHGGFRDHGCWCEGCRHVMFLGLGPDFRTGYVSYEHADLRDIAPTIGEVMGFETPYATGRVLHEVLVPEERRR